MSDEDNKGKKPHKPVKKSVLPAQDSAQDTSNWDDRAFSTPSGREVIENTVRRKKRSELGENESWGVAPPRNKKRQPREVMYKPLPTRAEQIELEKYNQKNVEPSSEQDT